MNKFKVFTFLVFFALLLSLSAIRPSHGQEAKIEINPATLDVVDPSLPEEFTVDVNVTDIEDVWQWQVKVYFDTAIIQCVSAELPTGHIFYGQTVIAPDAQIDNVGNATGIGSVLYGANLMTMNEPYNTFNGSGIMCRFTFNATDYGSSILEFAKPGETFYTFAADPSMTDITTTLVDGTVNVIVDEFPNLLPISILMIATIAATVLGKKIRLKK